MKREIIKRLISLVIILFGLSLMTFGLTYILPSNPAEQLAESMGAGHDREVIAKIEEKYGNVSGERWEVQQAWDKQATFLSAQSRAMQTLTNMIKQYDAMVESGMANQEQKARIELLRAQVKKIQEDPENNKASSKVVIVNDLDQVRESEDRQTE